MQKITVVGTGYVGLVTGVCLADTGNRVRCVDLDADKIEKLRAGAPPIFEPALTDLLTANLAAGRLSFGTDSAEAVAAADVVFICVDTPPRADGSADTSRLEEAAQAVARAATGPCVIAIKSTAPVGTAAQIERMIAAHSAHRLTVVSNPEFLKEGSAVEDFQRPDRVIIGSDDAAAADRLRAIYEPFVRNKRPILLVSREAAELVKYAANSYLAMRISYINQIAELCGRLGVDVDDVRRGIGCDDRIGNEFLYPGIGYGGSCFPKDIPALCALGRAQGVDLPLLDAVHRVNVRQPLLLLEAARAYFGGRLSGRTFALWGVAFKPRTDDLREAPALRIIDGLLTEGAALCAHDPRALPNLRRAYGDKLRYADDAYDALKDADALFICTEWNEFRAPDFARLRAALRRPAIFDGRNLYAPDQVRSAGLDYFSIGRVPVRRG